MLRCNNEIFKINVDSARGLCDTVVGGNPAPHGDQIMTDTTTNTAGSCRRQARGRSQARTHRRRRGDHTDIGSAIGIRYTDKATNQKFEYIIPGGARPAGSPLTMLALFGARDEGDQ